MAYTPSEDRYTQMKYHRCGRSGVQLPAVSLGLWQNFGGVDIFDNFREILWKAFDRGITHFDLANNYGPPPGSAEENFGKILHADLAAYRDEMIISTKAGYNMWPGPYGEWGSRKYLLSSLDQSLRRMNLEYVDIFYSHRFDPDTPLEETMGALAHAVHQGKAIYCGISNYPADKTEQAIALLNEIGVRCLIHQPKYSMFVRWVEDGLMDVLDREGVGCIAFSPLAQGLLTNKYLKGIPPHSRAAHSNATLRREDITEVVVSKIARLNDIAASRGQSLAQMALAWVLKDPRVTSVLIGASSVAQLEDNLAALNNTTFLNDELTQIETILHD
jgi:L-glyceraldehyde 3-phosphate reductase